MVRSLVDDRECRGVIDDIAVNVKLLLALIVDDGVPFDADFDFDMSAVPRLTLSDSVDVTDRVRDRVGLCDQVRDNVTEREWLRELDSDRSDDNDSVIDRL